MASFYLRRVAIEFCSREWSTTRPFSYILTRSWFVYILWFNHQFSELSYSAEKFNSKNRNNTHSISILKKIPSCAMFVLYVGKTGLSQNFIQVPSPAKTVTLHHYSGTYSSINHVMHACLSPSVYTQNTVFFNEPCSWLLKQKSLCNHQNCPL